MVVLTKEGIFETVDAGAHWTLVSGYPPGMPKGSLRSTRCSFGLAYDSQHETFFVSAPNGNLGGATLWRYSRQGVVVKGLRHDMNRALNPEFFGDYAWGGCPRLR